MGIVAVFKMVVLLVFTADLCHAVCDPVPVNSTIHVTCTPSMQPNDTVQWTLSNNTALFTCAVAQTCANGHNFMGSFTQVPPYTSTLTIHNLSIPLRNVINPLTCVFDDTDRVNASCIPDVYSVPVFNSCINTTLTDLNTEINVTCTAKYLYPNISTCTFYRDTSFSQSQAYIEVTTIQTAPDGDYFQATCQLTINVTTLSTGIYNFYPRIYVSNHPSVLNASASFQIRSPTAKLGSKCSNLISNLTDYIVKGGEARCVCEITDPGYPPGYVQWFTSQQKPVGDFNKVDRTAELSIDFSKQDTEPKYFCKIITVRGTSSALELTLQKTTPPTLLSSSSDMEKFTTSENGNVYIIIHFYSNPRPTLNSLYLTVDKKSANFTVPSQKYTTLVTFKSIWRGQVNLAIMDIGPDDMGTYTLTVGNGLFPDMVYRFILEEETDYTPIAIGVGVSVGILLIIAVVVAVVCYLKRRSLGRAPPMSRPATPNGNYSRATSKHADEHQYETVTSPTPTHLPAGIQSAADPPKQKLKVNKKDQKLTEKLQAKNKHNAQKPTATVVEVAEYANSKSIADSEKMEEIYEN